MKRISTVKRYKIRPDGSLRFVGLTHVTVDEKTAPSRIPWLDLRNRIDAARREVEIEDFESLVDAACED